MPLARESLPDLANAVGWLLGALAENTKLPSKASADALYEQRVQLRKLLTPSKPKHLGMTTPEIEGADLPGPLRVRLRRLWELVGNPRYFLPAYRDETKEFLQLVLDELEDQLCDRVPKGKPGSPPKYPEALIDLVGTLRMKSVVWKDVWKTCKRKFPDVEFPEFDSFKRHLQRQMKQRREQAVNNVTVGD
jgi:hypothetical protein